MFELLLCSRPNVMPITILEQLQEQYPGPFPDSLFHTLQRRIKGWKLKCGESPEVMFRQEHHKLTGDLPMIRWGSLTFES